MNEDRNVVEAMRLPTLENPQFSRMFIEMVAMKAVHELEKRLKDQPEALQLVDALWSLLLYESYLHEHPTGMDWFNNQMAAEAIGEVSHLVKWEVE